MNKEVWASVSGYEDLYEISSRGKVYSTYSGMLKPFSTKGYLSVTLCKNKVRRNEYIHILVATAFIGEKPIGTEVNHKDLNRANNVVDNLEWITHAENIEHGAILSGRAKLTREKVRYIREAYATLNITQQDLADQLGVCTDTIHDVIHGNTWKHVQ